MHTIEIPYTIELPLLELTRERNYRAKYNTLTLGENYLENKARYKSEIQDEHTLVWEEGIAHFQIKVKKESIAALSFRYWKKNDLYCVEIDVDGMADTLYLWFQERSEGQKVFDIIDNWLYGNKM